MHTYCLLRNNREYGPFNVQDLKGHGLFTTDLVWVEGSSVAWAPAVAFEELAAFAKMPPTAVSEMANTKFEATSGQKQSGATIAKDLDDMLVINAGVKKQSHGAVHAIADPFLHDELYSLQSIRNTRQQKQQIFSRMHLATLVLLLLGGAVVAFGIRLITKGLDDGAENVLAEAREIKPEKLEASTASYTAKVGSPVDGSVLKLTPPVPKNESELSLKSKSKAVNAPSTPAEKFPGKKTESAITPENEAIADEKKMIEAENSVAATERKNLATTNAVQLSGNKYKVGLLGGISGLEIMVSNTSSQPMNNCVVEVDYLKPNGDVIKTIRVIAPQVEGGGHKIITVPASRRGVAVRYRMVAVQHTEEIIATDNQ